MSFSADLKRFAGKSIANAELVRKRSAIELFRRVILRTPVDKGVLRNSWELGEGPPATDPVAGPHAKHGAIVAAVDLAKVLQVSPGAPLVLQNRQPYAYRIEYEGWSRQAPAGMVRISAAEFDGIVNVEARKVRK